jgi:hypothetical protein
VVGRDGIEPPTPGFSVLLGCCYCDPDVYLEARRPEWAPRERAGFIRYAWVPAMKKWQVVIEQTGRWDFPTLQQAVDSAGPGSKPRKVRQGVLS